MKNTSVRTQRQHSFFLSPEDVAAGCENVRRPSSPPPFQSRIYSLIINRVFCKCVTLPNMCSEHTRSWQHMCRYGCQSSSTLPVHIPAYPLSPAVK